MNKIKKRRNNLKNQVIIKLEHVYKEYGKAVKTLVLKDINLEIYESEFVCIMGPSGSGKSTLLNLISLLDRPTKGRIFINNFDVSKLNENQRSKIRRKTIGFVFQNFNLIPNFTVLENVNLPLILDNKKPDERSIEILTRFGLKERLMFYPNQLSGGQKQRTAIARALINNPDIIIADEPTGNLDSKSGKIVMELIKDLNKKDKKTIILVTHDPTIAKYSDRIIKIKDGMISLK